jgi:hypothetical protein
MFALCGNRTRDLLRSRLVFRPLRQIGDQNDTNIDGIGTLEAVIQFAITPETYFGMGSLIKYILKRNLRLQLRISNKHGSLTRDKFLMKSVTILKQHDVYSKYVSFPRFQIDTYSIYT